MAYPAGCNLPQILLWRLKNKLIHKPKMTNPNQKARLYKKFRCFMKNREDSYFIIRSTLVVFRFLLKITSKTHLNNK